MKIKKKRKTNPAKEVYRPVLSQLSYKKQSFKCLTLEICMFLQTSLSSPLFFPYPLLSARFYKSKSQIFHLCSGLHMQKVRNCPLRYIIDKKVLEKIYWGKNYHATCFLFTIGILCPFHFHCMSISSFMT